MVILALFLGYKYPNYHDTLHIDSELRVMTTLAIASSLIFAILEGINYAYSLDPKKGGHFWFFFTRTLFQYTVGFIIVLIQTEYVLYLFREHSELYHNSSSSSSSLRRQQQERQKYGRTRFELCHFIRDQTFSICESCSNQVVDQIERHARTISAVEQAMSFSPKELGIADGSSPNSDPATADGSATGSHFGSGGMVPKKLSAIDQLKVILSEEASLRSFMRHLFNGLYSFHSYISTVYVSQHMVVPTNQHCLTDCFRRISFSSFSCMISAFFCRNCDISICICV